VGGDCGKNAAVASGSVAKTGLDWKRVKKKRLVRPAERIEKSRERIKAWGKKPKNRRRVLGGKGGGKFNVLLLPWLTHPGASGKKITNPSGG